MKDSDKSYGETTYQWWETLLNENPSKRNIRLLKNEVVARENKIERLKEEHGRVLKDPFTGVEPQLSVLELQELHEEALHHLKKLLEKYDKPPLTLEEWIEEFVDKFSTQPKDRDAYIKYALYLYRKNLDKPNTKLRNDLEEKFGELAVGETRMSSFIRDFRSAYNSRKN